jgi:hypothetical protein
LSDLSPYNSAQKEEEEKQKDFMLQGDAIDRIEKNIEIAGDDKYTGDVRNVKQDYDKQMERANLTTSDINRLQAEYLVALNNIEKAMRTERAEKMRKHEENLQFVRQMKEEAERDREEIERQKLSAGQQPQPEPIRPGVAVALEALKNRARERRDASPALGAPSLLLGSTFEPENLLQQEEIEEEGALENLSPRQEVQHEDIKAPENLPRDPEKREKPGFFRKIVNFFRPKPSLSSDSFDQLSLFLTEEKKRVVNEEDLLEDKSKEDLGEEIGDAYFGGDDAVESSIRKHEEVLRKQREAAKLAESTELPFLTCNQTICRSKTENLHKKNQRGNVRKKFRDR